MREGQEGNQKKSAKTEKARRVKARRESQK